ncbi:hypothetical protein OBO34_20860 [Clostridiales Family XIII bacterium ASD5510]|uniref:Uncharacterized protein n=1 Tax=Hominibacterium faecale TaxID=2839743 RepID=A0A9J6QZ63_9FIRM|nr:hypothetical protein [Hominibacterium faecale]MCU7380768.1 hypothetical protein [Hominibacterium faecale]
MKKRIICLITAAICFALAGCSIPKYSESELEDAKEAAYEQGQEDAEGSYDSGYESGYRDGIEEGKDQKELEIEENYGQVDYDEYLWLRDNIVFTTKTGKKYHRSTCQYVEGREIWVHFIERAEENGYATCSVCF